MKRKMKKVYLRPRQVRYNGNPMENYVHLYFIPF